MLSVDKAKAMSQEIIESEKTRSTLNMSCFLLISPLARSLRIATRFSKKCPTTSRLPNGTFVFPMTKRLIISGVLGPTLYSVARSIAATGGLTARPL
jgi:hypothetical protein